MFTKLSAALVAISLVAVAQPGLAQISAQKQAQQTINVQNEYSTGTIGNGAGGVFGGRAGVKFTDGRVIYFGGYTTTVNADVTLDGVAVTAWPADADDPDAGEWWPLKSLDKAGLPTLFRKAAESVLGAGGKV